MSFSEIVWWSLVLGGVAVGGWGVIGVVGKGMQKEEDEVCGEGEGVGSKKNGESPKPHPKTNNSIAVGSRGLLRKADKTIGHAVLGAKKEGSGGDEDDEEGEGEGGKVGRVGEGGRGGGEGEGGEEKDKGKNGIRVGSNPLLEISSKNNELASSSNLDLEISHDAARANPLSRTVFPDAENDAENDELLPGDAMPVDDVVPAGEGEELVLPDEPNVMRAVASFTPRASDELLVGMGDVVTVLERFPDGWVMACNEGVCGVIPASFLSALSAGIKWSTSPSSPDELLVHKGDMVDVYEFYDDGWALVVGPTGAAGMVPQAYLDRSIATPLTPLDSPIL